MELHVFHFVPLSLPCARAALRSIYAYFIPSEWVHQLISALTAGRFWTVINMAR